MLKTIKAVYEGGQFRPLEAVELADGQQVQLMIASEREAVRLALGDLVAPPAYDQMTAEDNSDDDAALREIEQELGDHPSLSSLIIQERDAQN
jgi:predicted DNA-binding antitoxin AbrB/MazE fold protein